MTSAIDFSSGKYLTSPTGILRILVIILLLSSAIIFLSSENCLDAPSWYNWVYPLVILISAVIVTINYALYVCGVITDFTSNWIRVDIVLNLIESGCIILVSVTTMLACSSLDGLSKIPGPLGIIAGAILAISTATLYITWANSDGQGPEVSYNIEENRGKIRKSILV